MPAATGEVSFEVTSHGPHGEIYNSRNELIKMSELVNKPKLIGQAVCS